MIVCGLGFGDEGKGTIVDYIVRERGARVVVRYGGGPQAGHNVVTDDGRWHCFAQLGAGSFAGATTMLGPGMLVELEALEAERDVLASKRGTVELVIDPDCTVITPMHKLVNQLGELAAARGSCGMGVGEAVKWRERGLALRVGDVAERGRDVLEQLAATGFAYADVLLGNAPSQAMLEVYRHFRTRCDSAALATRYASVLAQLDVARVALDDGAVFEGAQGALLDRTRGWDPLESTCRHASLSIL